MENNGPYFLSGDGISHTFIWNGKYHQHTIQLELGLNVSIEFYGTLPRVRIHAVEWDRNPLNGPANVTSQGFVQFPGTTRCKYKFGDGRTYKGIGCYDCGKTTDPSSKNCYVQEAN